MDDRTYLHHSEREELVQKLFKLQNVNKDGKISYCGKMYSPLFRENMEVYHHEEGSTVFLTSQYMVLKGKLEHILASKKSLEKKLGIILN